MNEGYFANGYSTIMHQQHGGKKLGKFNFFGYRTENEIGVIKPIKEYGFHNVFDKKLNFFPTKNYGECELTEDIYYPVINFTKNKEHSEFPLRINLKEYDIFAKTINVEVDTTLVLTIDKYKKIGGLKGISNDAEIKFFGDAKLNIDLDFTDNFVTEDKIDDLYKVISKFYKSNLEDLTNKKERIILQEKNRHKYFKKVDMTAYFIVDPNNKKDELYLLLEKGETEETEDF